MKSQLLAWLAGAEFQKIVDASLAQSRTLRVLITITYEGDILMRWRAIDAIGRCAGRLCTIRPGSLKNLLRRLFWMMSDESGAIAWHAPEAIGEIIRSNPVAFAEFIPMTIALLELEPEDLPPFLPGILYALGRIGEAAPERIREGLPGITAALANPDPQIRAMAVWSLGMLGARDALKRHRELAHDSSEALVYREERLQTLTIAMFWAESMRETRSAK
jgi:HEAT repeat protein